MNTKMIQKHKNKKKVRKPHPVKLTFYTQLWDVVTFAIFNKIIRITYQITCTCSQLNTGKVTASFDVFNIVFDKCKHGQYMITLNFEQFIGGFYISKLQAGGGK
jgi:hypothetical protein